VSFVLSAIGLVLLVISLAGIALGLYMAADKRTRSRGRLFAVLWVPALAASSGVLMRDVVTFTVGLLCFLVAGTVFALQGDKPYEPPASTGRPGQRPRRNQIPRLRRDHQRKRNPRPGKSSFLISKS
jgi:hypothetical protein